MRIAVLTSGGDAPGMNAAIRAVVRACVTSNVEVFGVYDGFRGLVENKFQQLTHKDVSGLLSIGGTFLGTSRLSEFSDIEVQKKAYNNLQSKGIDALVVIGGDGSYRGAQALSKMGVKTIGLPGTIDNDVVGTEYTIGFHTAVQTIVEAIDKLRDTSTSHRRVSIVEVMGRNSGDLALYAGICGGAEFIITPENQVDKNEIFKQLSKHHKAGRRHAIIVVTENQFDVHELAKEITENSGFNSRATVLGYIQRGGSPVAQDRILASRMGAFAIELLHSNVSGVCVGVQNNILIYESFDQVVDKKKPKDDLYRLVRKIS